MSENQKRQIIEMRKGGHSYKAISDYLRVSINTVKSFCRRNAVELAQTINDEKKEGICEECGAPVFQFPNRKRKRFCSDQCRLSWWSNERRKKKIGKNHFCAYCKVGFQSHGNRKYCSHACYIKDRFGAEV